MLSEKRKDISIAFLIYVLLSLIVGALTCWINSNPLLANGTVNRYFILLSIMLLLVGLLVFNATSNGFDIFEPINLITLTYMQVFVLAPYVWLANGQESWMGVPIMHNLPIGSLFFLMGYLAFYFGYLSGLKRPCLKNNYSRVTNEQARVRIVVLSVFIFVTAFIGATLYLRTIGVNLLFALSLGRYKSEAVTDLVASSPVYFLNMFNNTMISAFMLLYAFQKKYRWLLVPLFVLTLLMLMARGNRYRILILVLAPIVFNCLKSGKRPKTSTAVTMVIIAFIIVSVIGLWRNSIKGGAELQTINLNGLIMAYMPNIEIFFPFYRLLDAIPSTHSFYYGLSYISFFTQLIPRVLWPAKPVTPIQEIMTICFGRVGAASGPAYPNIGEFYTEFGLPGIIIGMYLFGRFAKWSKTLYEKPRSEFALIGYSMLLPYFLQIVCRGHFPSIMIEVIFTFGPVLALNYWASKSRSFQYAGTTVDYGG